MTEPAEYAQAISSSPAPAAHPVQKISFLTDGTGERAYWSHFLVSLHGLRVITRRERFASLLTASVGAGIFGTMAGFFIASRNPDHYAFAAMAGAILAVPCLLYGINGGPWTKWRRKVRALVRDHTPSEAQAVTVSVSPAGYTAEFTDSSRTIRWSGISQIIRLDRWIVICHADRWDADAIPVSAFPDDPAADACFVHACALLDASGHGPDARVRAALDQGPVRCGRCGYNLVGVRVAKCPECGIELSPFQIALWRQLKLPLYKHLLALLGFRR